MFRLINNKHQQSSLSHIVPRKNYYTLYQERMPIAKKRLLILYLEVMIESIKKKTTKWGKPEMLKMIRLEKRLKQYVKK